MKRMKQLAQQMLRHRTPHTKGKKGSSMALVMIITSALVIWAMALAPLMTTTGTAALKVQTGYEEYLGSRSAIEFAKSELELIVRDRPPYTFAVVQANDGTYAAIPRYSGATINSAYSGIVTYDALDSRKDVPNSTTGGHVAAICAVELQTNSNSTYDIVINTFHDGEKGMSYKASFRQRGSLLIYPESYRQTQALPLSDFVLVDGKLGANRVWDSTITMSKVNSIKNGNASLSSVTETLLPWILEDEQNAQPGYASSGEYPAVFKTTAHAAVSTGGVVGDPIDNPVYTTDLWIRPMQGSAGNVLISTTNSKVTVKIDDIDVTSQCRFYYNGVEGSSAFPTATGKYRISVDYPGTGAEYTKDVINILPCYGIDGGTITVGTATGTHSNPSPAISNIIYNSGSFNVTFSDASLIYGYCTAEDTGTMVWNAATGDTIENLRDDKTYYFYGYKPASLSDEGIYYKPSVAIYAGVVYPYKAVDSLVSGKQYLVVNDAGYAMKDNVTIEDWYGYYKREVHSLQVTNVVGAFGTINAGVFTAIPDKSLLWTMERGDSGWSFGQYNYDENYYLTLDAQARRSGYNNYYLSNFSSKLDNNRDQSFVIAGNTASETLTRRTSWLEGRVDVTGTVYLNIDNDKVTASETAKNIYFVALPDSAPFTTYTIADKSSLQVSDFAANPGSTAVSLIDSQLPENVSAATLYFNGTAITGSTTLAPGSYQVSGITNDGRIILPLTVTVGKYAPSGTLSVSAQSAAENDCLVTITGSGWNSNSGIRYLGYKGETDTDFRWFATTESSVTVCIPYGKYTIAAAESGTISHSARAAVTTDFTLNAALIDLPEDAKEQFQYTFVDGAVVWYKLPENVTPNKLTMVYGAPGEGDSINWSFDISADTRFYGVLIAGTDYKDLTSVFQLPPRIGITNENGHTSSMVRGSSLYFMSSGKSINTHGNNIYLYTDLLVLRNSPEGGGEIIVAPYTSGKKTLVFAVNEIVLSSGVSLAAKNFYLIPEDVNLYNLNAGDLASIDDGGYRVGAIDYDAADGTDTMYRVKQLFRFNGYPEPNMDVAYASDAQLNRIVSGETIGWTSDGELNGTDSNTNESYVVCPYITNISRAESLKANRVLIAAKTADGSSATLSVPYNVIFTTRYLSVDAETIQQIGNVAFTIKNLTKDPTFLSILGFSKYESRSLQMDYERATLIVKQDGSERPVRPQIYRYNDGTDIFSVSDELNLMAKYSVDEIEDWFEFFGTTLTMVDRYVWLTGEGTDGKLGADTFLGATLNSYSNYIYVDEYVREISVTGLISGGLVINTQENGYTEKEYLGLFRNNTAESYSGTLIYFANDITIKTTEYILVIPYTNTYTLPKGFYYIYAKDGGTGVTKLATDLFTGSDLNENTQKKPYKVDEATLEQYSIYINRDGTLSNAYVDTGLYDDNNATTGGFYGGAIE